MMEVAGYSEIQYACNDFRHSSKLLAHKFWLAAVLWRPRLCSMIAKLQWLL